MTKNTQNPHTNFEDRIAELELTLTSTRDRFLIIEQHVDHLETQNTALMERISRLEEFLTHDAWNWDTNTTDSQIKMLENDNLTKVIVETIKAKLYVTSVNTIGGN